VLGFAVGILHGVADLASASGFRVFESAICDDDARPTRTRTGGARTGGARTGGARTAVPAPPGRSGSRAWVGAPLGCSASEGYVFGFVV